MTIDKVREIDPTEFQSVFRGYWSVTETENLEQAVKMEGSFFPLDSCEPISMFCMWKYLWNYYLDVSC